MSLIFGIIIIIVGLILLLKPSIIWKNESALFIKNGEPTKFWFIVARASGILAITVGIIVMLYA